MTFIACLDVDYREGSAHSACVVIDGWDAQAPARLATATHPAPAGYEPGAFYKRELPALLAVLARVAEPLAAIVIDGYVWLGRDGEPGLGARLYEAIARRTAVVGVAKTAFRGDDWSQQVLRGTSSRPLFVTAAGMDPSAAADAVRRMHGEHRIPTMLQLADASCRGRGA